MKEREKGVYSCITLSDIHFGAQDPEKLYNELKEGVLKKTNQGFVFCEFIQIPPPTEPVVKNTATRFIQDEEFVKFTEIVTPNTARCISKLIQISCI